MLIDEEMRITCVNMNDSNEEISKEATRSSDNNKYESL